jgi:diguanylate cyclase (GGDEF)-like protein
VVDELELRILATSDSLTGALRRRAFHDEATRDITLAMRHDRALSCLLIDADHFKAVNDTYGHSAGDLVLRRIVEICRSTLRASDYVGRIGG